MSLTVNFDIQNQKVKPKSKITIRQTNPVIGEKLNGGAKVNGIIEHFEQGGHGDCRLLSQLIGLSNNPYGRMAIKNSIKPDGIGGAIVTFKGAKGKKKEFRINIEEFLHEKEKVNQNQPRRFSKGDDDVIILELAIVKYLKLHNILIDKAIGLTGFNLHELNEGELVELIMGEDTQFYCLDSNTEVEVALEEFEKNPQKHILTTSFKENHSIGLSPMHEYAIKRIINKNNKKYIVYNDPSYSTKERIISYEDYFKNVSAANIYELDAKNRNKNLMPYVMEGRDKFLRVINKQSMSDIKQYINSLSNKQRYLFMLKEAKTMINKLDNKTFGWGNSQNKKDLIYPFVDSCIQQAKFYGVKKDAINKFKTTCIEELDATFYTNASNIINAFYEFIEVIAKTKENYYNK